MSLFKLKSLRKLVSLVVLFSIAAVFVDPAGWLPQGFISGALYFQLVPSVLKLSLTVGAAGAGCIFIFILTLLSGRIYCSFLCPLGTFMDLIARAFASLKKSSRKKFTTPHNRLRYLILTLTLLFFAFGSNLLLNLLDPYSNFGRIMAFIFKPGFALSNNILAAILERLDNYSISPQIQVGVNPWVILFVCSFLLLITWMAVKKGRLYCNTLCPVGALLGLFSKFSATGLGIDRVSCTGCGRCERVCKADCIDPGQQQIDVTRCVSCFNCIDACPAGSISFISRWKKHLGPAPEHPNLNPGRRALMAAGILFISGLGSKIAHAASKPVVYVKNKIRPTRNHPITPPGAVSENRFTSRCTGCNLCVSACPGKVLRPTPAGFGTQGVFIPQLDNRHGYCNFRCTTCGRVCPTGAIQPLDLDSKKRTQIGKVIFIRENCIVITQKTECGACSEHCPTKAVFMQVKNNLRVPAVNPDICVGCGACEYACPAIPFKSIYVEGNPVHLEARLPEPARRIQEEAPVEEFPF